MSLGQYLTLASAQDVRYTHLLNGSIFFVAVNSVPIFTVKYTPLVRFTFGLNGFGLLI